MKAAIVSLSLVALVSCQSQSPAPESTGLLEQPSQASAEQSGVPTNLVELLSMATFEPSLNLTFDNETAELLESIPVTAVGPPEMRLLQLGDGKETTAVAEPEYFVIGLEHAFAPALANTLSRLTRNNRRGVKTRTEILADERTNSLLVMAGEEHVEQIKELIAILDVKVEK